MFLYRDFDNGIQVSRLNILIGGVNMHKGSCLCGKVKLKITADLGSGDMCHCRQCRQWTGHIYAGVDVPRGDLTIEGEEYIQWYYSSEKVRRGFCKECGSSLFFDPVDQEKHKWIGVTLGVLDSPTNTTIELHIFTAEKGDYYQILDGAKQNKH